MTKKQKVKLSRTHTHRGRELIPQRKKRKVFGSQTARKLHCSMRMGERETREEQRLLAAANQKY